MLPLELVEPPLDNLKVRQAIAYALNREAVVKAKYLPDTLMAKEFVPPTIAGYADDVAEYHYDPDRHALTPLERAQNPCSDVPGSPENDDTHAARVSAGTPWKPREHS